jgi:hypothetical protein
VRADRDDYDVTGGSATIRNGSPPVWKSVVAIDDGSTAGPCYIRGCGPFPPERTAGRFPGSGMRQLSGSVLSP